MTADERLAALKITLNALPADIGGQLTANMYRDDVWAASQYRYNREPAQTLLKRLHQMGITEAYLSRIKRGSWEAHKHAVIIPANHYARGN